MKKFNASKKYFFLLIGIVAATLYHSFAQPIIEKSFSNSMKLQFHKSIQLANGDFLFTVASYPVAVDSTMALLIKTDSLLQLKWSKRFKVFHNDFFTTVTWLQDGNLLIGGSIREDFNQLSGGSIYKMDTAGNVIWHKVYSDSYDDAVLNVFDQPDSSLMIFIRLGVNNYPTKVIHTDKTGNIISARELFNGSLALFAESVEADNSGNFYMAGTIYNTSTSLYSLFVCSVTESGFNWYKEYDFGRDVTSGGIVLLSDGNLGISGGIVDSVFSSSSNTWVAKLDIAGNIIYANEYGQSLAYTESLWQTLAADNAGMIFLGQANTSLGFQALGFKLNNAGNLQWCNSYGNFPYQYFYEGDILSDGRILIAGTDLNLAYTLITTPGGISACNSTARTFVTVPLQLIISNPVITTNTISLTPSSPALIISNSPISENLICSGGVGIPEHSNTETLNMYPQPASEILYINAGKYKNYEIKIFNPIGELVLKQKNNSQINISHLRNGIYELIFETNENRIAKKFQVIH